MQLKRLSAGEEPQTGCLSDRARPAGALIGKARRRSFESLKSGQREVGLIRRGPTGFRTGRPATVQAQERSAASKRIGRRPTNACGDEPATLHEQRARQTRERQSPRQHSPRPKIDRRRKRLARTGQSPEGAPAALTNRPRDSRCSQVRLGWRPMARRKPIGRLGWGERQVGLRRGKRGRNCPAGAKLRRAKSQERCRLAGHHHSARHAGQAAKDR